MSFCQKAEESTLLKIISIKPTTAILEGETIHVASAESLSGKSLAFVAYDKKLLAYVKALGVDMTSPK